jgi:hypothetical protein
LKSYEFLKNEEFTRIVHQTLERVLSLLLKNGVPFSILTNIARVNFEPKPPLLVTQKFEPFTLFVLENYTFSSAKLTDDCLTFEAGFGENNFASLVSVPLGAILRIVIEDLPIFLNMSIDTIKPAQQKTSKKEDNLKNSLEALLNNPENKNLFKK